MMTPETAMGQASSTALEYLQTCLQYVEYAADQRHKKPSPDSIFMTAALLAVAASIDYHGAAVGGFIRKD